jgi:hypothetical protein
MIEPWHPAIHQVAASDVSAVESDAISQVMSATIEPAAHTMFCASKATEVMPSASEAV